MALTPEDVRSKLFTTVRLREGYEQTEVDEFLDEVEAELMRLLQENDRLRAQAGAAGTTSSADSAPAVAALPPMSLQKSTPPAPEQRAAPQEIVVRTSGEVSAAAARVLEMAQRTAEQFLGEARTEADKLVVDALAEAEQLNSEARSKADAIDRETHERTTTLERELADRRSADLDQLQGEKRRLESEVETLRSFEREYRGRLRTFLEGQLEQLSVRGSDDTPLAPEGGPVQLAPPAVEPEQDVLSSPTDAVDESGQSPNGGQDVPAGSDGTDPEAAAGTAGDSPSNASRESQATGGRSGRRSRSALGRILEEEERNADGS